MKSYGEDLFEHCKYYNCYSCGENVLERRLNLILPHSHLNALYELAYHVKKGRVRVPVTLVKRLFETNNEIGAVYLLSKLVKNSITALDEKDFLVLEIVEKENV